MLSTFWDANDPVIFIMLGGEGPISPAYVNGHFIIGDLAQQFSALQVVLEHRFCQLTAHQQRAS